MRPLLLAISCFALVHAAPRPVHACSPPLPGLSSTFPATGGNLPANAAIHFFGYSITLDGVTVTVNGSAATLAEVPSRGFGELAARVTPEPAVGASVVVSGTFCPSGQTCDAQSLSYTVTAPDNAAPAAPALQVNLHDYPDTSTGVGSCQPDSTAAWWFHLQGTPAADGEALVLHVVEVADGSTFSSPFRTITRVANAADVTTAIRLDVASVLNRDLLGGFCFRAFSVDAAGNTSPFTAITCTPCHARVENADAGTLFSPPQEPEWTGSDIVGTGPCAGGSSSSGGGPSSSSSAAASSSAASSSTGAASASGSASSASAASGSASSAAASSAAASSSGGGADAGTSDGGQDLFVERGGCGCGNADARPGAAALGVALLVAAGRRARRRAVRD